MMVPFPSESRERKETYPVPWGGIEPPKRFWVQGLPWGMIPFITGRGGSIAFSTSRGDDPNRQTGFKKKL